MAGVNTTEYVLQALFEVKIFDLETGGALALLNDLKNTTWSNNGNTIYATGGRGGSKIMGFGSQKESNLEIASATITDGILAIQTGVDMETLTASTEIMYTDDEIVISSDAGASKFTATGTADEEFVSLHILNDTGSLGLSLTQVSGVPGAGDFAYDDATKAITTSGLDDGTKLVGFYYPTLATGKKFVNKTDVFAKNVKIVADGLFRDPCTGTDYAGQLVFDKAKIGEEYSFALDEAGEPAVHGLNAEALRSCSSSNLWDLYIFDEGDLS